MPKDVNYSENPLLEIWRDSKKRVTSRFVLSFIFTWIWCHWEMVLYLLMTSDTVDHIIHVIKHCYLSNRWWDIGAPALLGLVFTIAIPYVNAFIKIAVSKSRELSDNSDYKVKLNSAGERVRLATLRREAEEAESNLKTFQDQRDEIRKLNQRIEALQNYIELNIPEKPLPSDEELEDMQPNPEHDDKADTDLMREWKIALNRDKSEYKYWSGLVKLLQTVYNTDQFPTGQTKDLQKFALENGLVEAKGTKNIPKTGQKVQLHKLTAKGLFYFENS